MKKYLLLFLLAGSVTLLNAQSGSPKGLNNTRGKSMASQQFRGNESAAVPAKYARLMPDLTRANSILNDSVKYRLKTFTEYTDTSVIRTTNTMDRETMKLTKLEEHYISGSWVPFTRTTEEFDNNGFPAVVLVEAWTGSSWTGISRTTSSYTPAGSLLSSNSDQWIGGAWTTVLKFTCQYDAHENCTYRCLEMIVEGTTIYGYRYKFTYDSQNRQLEAIWETTGAEGWVNHSRIAHTYLSNPYTDIILQQEWVNGAWMDSYRQTYIYDQQNQEISHESEVWSGTAWEKEGRESYTYRNDGKILSHLTEKWNVDKWVSESRESYSYDASGNNTETLSQLWGDGAWFNYFRFCHTYDQKSNELQLLYQMWGSTEWNNLEKKDYVFDGSGNCIKAEQFTYMDNAWQNKSNDITLYYNYGKDSFDAYGYKVEAAYNSVPVSVEENNDNLPAEFSLQQNYPNPFNPSTTISYNLPEVSFVQLSVFDVLGQEVAVLVNSLQAAGQHNAVFNAAGLPGGVYLCRINAGHNTSVKKMLLLK